MERPMLRILGMSRSVMILIGIFGLILFIALMGFATHSALADFFPETPSWILIFLSVAGPIVALLVIGVGGALHQNEATRPKVQKFVKVIKFVLVLAATLWLIVQLLRSL